jgi:2-aminobenzoate-CoA ligase
MKSAHVDTFAMDHLPAADLQPEFVFDLPELQFPETLNCATELLDRHIDEGRGGRICLRTLTTSWTYRQLYEKANQIARVLVEDMGLIPGNRVLLRAANNPMLVACWFAVMKAGGIAVTTMPLLRAKELNAIIGIGQISHALCDAALAEELSLTEQPVLHQRKFFNCEDQDALEAAMESKPKRFVNISTSKDDTCLFAFTSGTTGIPKATMHFHRDVMAACACWPQSVLRADADDVFIGSPPLAFTFGLGGLVLFPMAIGASTLLLEKASPPQLLEAIQSCGATVLVTAPTSYRVLAAHGAALRETKLRKCVSAGEALPATTRALWRDATGIELIDGIGATELLHIFISADEESARPGATGLVVPGYEAQVVDDAGNLVAPGVVGKLRVKGPTGCRYLRSATSDAQQRSYVQGGWNYTGDAYVKDMDGYFFYRARTDDMIVSAGYNIAAPEVEDALMRHAAVAECGVIGVPDEERGHIVKAFVVLRPSYAPNEVMGRMLQDHVKQTIAPYKYPRAIKFVAALPRTATGKLQRFRLKES